MDNVTLSAADFLAPILHSHTNSELERAMVSVFTAIVQDTQIDQLNDIYSYAVPWQGSRTVVESFTKLNGLAVLRRNDAGLSDKIMSVIYSNWTSIASERGVGFLQFVLDMLYPNQNQIVSLWHSRPLASSYPRYVAESKGQDRFLTSRVRIKIDSGVNVAELSELTPTIARLVPWQVVAEVAVAVNTDNLSLQAAVGGKGYHVANFSPY